MIANLDIRWNEAGWGVTTDSCSIAAIYSLIWLQDQELAQELYFRIQDDPLCFPQLAREDSQGGEAYVGGIVGPIELGTIHPVLADMLAVSQPGQLWVPPCRRLVAHR